MTHQTSEHPDERCVLLVEDNPGDVRLVEEAFDEVDSGSTLYTVADGEEMLDFLHDRGEYESVPTPDLVLLDLNLPDRHGTELLERVQEDSALRRLPVVVLTSSEEREDVMECYRNDANAYLTKPNDHEGFVSLVESLDAFWFGRAKLPPVQ
jgi:CheY-like chemotaxis protein